MFKKLIFIMLVASFAATLAQAQTIQKNTDRALILPFENTSGKAEFNWVGESFADSLSELLKVPSLNVVSNQERKIVQQRTRVPLTVLPSLATSLKLARESGATLLITGTYNIIPAQGDIAASIAVTAKIISVNEGRFLSEQLSDGRRITRDINLSDALQNLQTVQGQVAYQILYQRDKVLPFSQNQFIESANIVPARSFEAYIKGLLTPASEDETRANFFKNALRIYAEEKSDEKAGEIYAEAALELGHLYLNKKKTGDAIEYFSQVPQTSPQYAEAAFYTGLIQWQEKNYEQALAVLRPLADDLKLTSVYNTLGAIAVQASRAERNDAKAAGLLGEGIDYLKKASDSATDETNPKFNYALSLFLKNKYKEAVEILRPILVSNPRDGESYFLLAKGLKQTGDETAEDIDNQARRFLTVGNRYANLEKDWEDGHSLKNISLRVEQPTRKDFVSVVLINKQNQPIQTQTSGTEAIIADAKNLYNGGNDDEAMAGLRKVLVSEPMSAQAYQLLGKIHLRRGDLEQAVSSLKTALFWDNRLIDAHVALGKIYLEKGDCLQAKNYSASASEIDSENPDAVALERQVERCSTK